MSLFDETPREEADQSAIRIDEPVRSELLDAARWAKFLSAMSFLYIGLLFASGIYLTLVMMRMYRRSGMTMGVQDVLTTGGIYPIGALLCLFPVYALLRFGSLMKAALQTSDQDRLNRALRYLRNMLRYSGIMAIVLLALVGLLLLFLLALAS